MKGAQENATWKRATCGPCAEHTSTLTSGATKEKILEDQFRNFFRHTLNNHEHVKR